MNAEQIADELIKARPRLRRPFKRRWRQGGIGRHLNVAEVCEFKAAVNAAIDRKDSLSRPADGTALCAGSDVGAPFCWNPNCPRCMPA